MPRFARHAVCALAVLLCFASAQAQVHRYSFDRREELVLDRTRVAVRLEPAALRTAELAALGDLKPWPIEGWRLLRLREECADEEAARDLVDALARMPGVTFASPVFVGQRGHPVFVTPWLLVQLRPGPDVAARAVLEEEGAGSIVRFDWGGLRHAYRTDTGLSDGFSVLERANALARREETVFAEPDWAFAGRKCSVPNDVFFCDQWALHFDDRQGVQVADCDIDGLEARDLSTGDPSVVIAIIDDGIQLDHPDLPHDVPGTDTTTDGPGSGSFVNIDDVHGTVCAGVIAARTNNGHGLAGLVPDARYATIRSYISIDLYDDAMMSSWVIAGLGFAEGIGARISHNAVSFSFSPAAVIAKYDQTRMDGMLHYASAGNEPVTGPTWPALIDSVDGIIAINRLLRVSGFSSRGPTMAFGAPGEAIRTVDRSPPSGYDPSGIYINFHGTTFACAYAAATAAMAFSINPALTADDVCALMIKSCLDLGAPGFDPLFNHGYMNAYSVAWDAALSLPDPSRVVYMQREPSAGDEHGAAVAGVGDVDGDGTPDFAVAAPGADGGGMNAGSVTVFSGADGSIVRTRPGAAGEGFGRTLASLGDVDGDGVDDLAAAAPDAGSAAGRVEILSGATGALIRRHTGAQPGDRLGAAIASVGDRDGDGRDDYALGAPGAEQGGTPGVGRVTVHSGLDGSVLLTFDGDDAAGDGEVGAAIDAGPDTTGDGIDELLVGAPGSASDAGRLLLVSGSNASVVQAVDGSVPLGRLGEAVATWGDLSGDGTPDLAAGAPGTALAGPDTGVVAVYSSTTGAIITGVLGEAAGDRFGSALAVSPDIDDDGLLDLLIGAPGRDAPAADAGEVYVYSEFLLRPRFRLTGRLAGQRFGTSVAALGDIDGDGLGEAVAGGPGGAPGPAGFSVVFPAPHPANLSHLGAAAAGSVSAGAGAPYDIFLVNESSGGLDRRVEVATGAPVRFIMQQPLARTTPAPYVLFAFPGVPGPGAATTLPGGAGDALFPPCSGAGRASGTGVAPLFPVCSPVFPLAFTESDVLLPLGFPSPATVTLQGLVEETPGSWKVTNAVVLVSI